VSEKVWLAGSCLSFPAWHSNIAQLRKWRENAKSSSWLIIFILLHEHNSSIAHLVDSIIGICEKPW